MDCREARELLLAHVDAELGVGEARAVESHLQDCSDCRAQHAAYATVRSRIQAHASYFPAPVALLERIEAALPTTTAMAHATPALKPVWHWLNLGGATALAIAIAWSVGLYMTLPSADDRLTDEVVSSHVRSLQSNHMVDVASSDQHTVKPWFNGKLDFSPPVLDLTAEGFPLVGGRLDYVDHRAVAALVYRRRQHLINVFIMPAADAAKDAPVTKRSRHGYHILRWARGGMAFQAVSDVDAGELVTLEEMLMARM